MDGTGDGASSVGSGAPDDITAADLDFVDTADLLSGDEESEAGGTGFTDDVTRMKVALANEKIAPELLAFQTELVDDLKQQIQRQQARLQRTRMRVFAAVYQMEIDRVKYLLASYLRTRLRKLERFAFHVLRDKSCYDRLSPAEFKFVRDYTDAKGNHLQRSLLQHLPENYRSLTEEYRSSKIPSRSISMIRRPKLDGVVFCQVTEDVGPYSGVDGSDSVDLAAGTSWIARYRNVQALVEDGRVRLA